MAVNKIWSYSIENKYLYLSADYYVQKKNQTLQMIATILRVISEARHRQMMLFFAIGLFLLGMSVDGYAQITAEVLAPASVSQGQPFDMTVRVNKGEIGGFAKLEHNLPEGFIAISIDAGGGTFKFADGKVKFLWMSLPSVSTFEVSFRISTPRESNGPHVISGVFSYIENSETVNYRVPDAMFLIADDDAHLSITNEPSTNESFTAASTDDGETVSQIQVSSERIETPVAKVQPTEKRTGLNAESMGVSVKAEDLVFRVQVLAGKNKISPDELAIRYGLDKEGVSVTEHEGLFKYLSGEFSNYRAAKALSDELRNTTGLPGPFVVAYRNGLRISVTDALY